jgi:hypothetical protein
MFSGYWEHMDRVTRVSAISGYVQGNSVMVAGKGTRRDAHATGRQTYLLGARRDPGVAGAADRLTSAAGLTD